MNDGYITFWDWLLMPFYLLIIFVIASIIRKRNIKSNPIYKYFLRGLFAKIFGAICICLVYVYYYKEGGDTLRYHITGQVFVNLFFDSPLHLLEVLFSSATPERLFYFNDDTGYPYFWTDTAALNVGKLITPLEFIGFKCFIISSILMAVLSFTGIWKLYLLFSELFPSLYKYFAFSILFVPSVIFWGSGLLKDSLTLCAACWFCVSFYEIFIRKKKIFYYTIAILISSFIMLGIKPYIFIALLPGCLLWMVYGRIVRIQNIILKIVAGPFIVSLGVGLGAFVWMNVHSGLGEYSSVDSMIKKASVASEDLKQDYYKGNSFDIGSYDQTVTGVLSKFPIATITGLFRPYLWEAKNIVMAISGLENLILLLFTLYCIYKRPAKFFSSIFSDPLILFCLSFAIIFAFSVAISTSNFGALVRLRIPLLPFYLSGIFIIHFNEGGRKNKLTAATD